MRFLFCILFLFPASFAFPQVAKSVVLDSITIQAVRQGFDVADFIEMVKSDTSFLRGFQNLRNNQHQVAGTVTVYGKKKKVVATRYKKARQHVENSKSWMEMQDENVTGDFYNRKNEPETYTAELCDEVFFYRDTTEVLPISQSITGETPANNQGNISKLKTLVFNPGAEIEGVPLVGKRMAIFDDEMVKYYDYAIQTKMYQDSISCYVFSCKAKPDAGDYPVLKNLNTWFDRKTFNVIYRDYQYQYSGVLFDFDVNIKVTMNYNGEVLYPANIIYNGYWDIPFHKEEKVNFNLSFNLLQ